MLTGARTTVCIKSADMRARARIYGVCESAQLAQNGERFKKTRGSWQGQVALQSTGLLLQATPESALTAQADAAHPLHGFRLEVGLSAVEADFAEHDAHCRSWPPLPERWPLRAGARAAFLLLKAFPEEVVQDPEWPPPSSPSTISDGADRTRAGAAVFDSRRAEPAASRISRRLHEESALKINRQRE